MILVLFGGFKKGLVRRFGEWKVAFVLQLPNIRDEFSGHRDDAFVLILAARFELEVALVEPVLHAPGEGFDFLGKTCLTVGQGGADFGSFSKMLRTLDKHPARVAVAAFGNASLSARSS